MATYKAPIRDMQFAFKEMIGTDYLRQLPGYEEISDDVIDAVITEAARFAETVLSPLNQSGDQEGCTWNNGVVTTPKGFKEAYQSFVEAGWPSLACDPEYGGQGLPEVISVVTEEMMCSSNLSFGLYPGLTRGAYVMLHQHGSEELKRKYLPKMVEGTWSGTMCLTEPHCGTDLGLLRTKAVPQEDGTYHVSGTKIFISSGEHDLTENIIHFVIARTPDGPEGIKGISLFLVPKFMVKEDGSLGERNSVQCASIEHKMGIRGSSTCVMNFDNAVGWLVGKLHHGVSNMFAMMNNERLGVGNQGLGAGELAYQNALTYARDRLQGRSLKGAKYPEKAADPLIVHPDVRRMLLTMKAYTEGNRMLTAWIGSKLDIAHRHPDAGQRQDADDLIQLMTPIVKAFMTDCGFDIANMGVQIMGGHGYIKEYGMEQIVRDARIAQIYEGTNGVQALDLVGRKIGANTGRYLRQFFHPVLAFIEEHKDNPVLADYIPNLAKAVTRLQQATSYIAMKGSANPDEAGAASVDYLRMFALTTLAYLFARAVLIADEKLKSTTEKTFYQSKIDTARFYYAKLLPQTGSLLSSIMAGAQPLMDVQDESFGPF
jgi:alkylation response protein AidB-like acyl-CoA dehydrogenase